MSRAGIRPFVLGLQTLSPLALLRDCRYARLPHAPSHCTAELPTSTVSAIERACDEHAIDMVIPADYEAALLLAQSPLRARRARVCALPDSDTLRTLHDKWTFLRLMQRLKLPHPRSELVPTTHAFSRLQLCFPLVTKPTNLSAGIGVQIHHSARALRDTLLRGRLRAPFPVLAQDYVHGRDVGYGFLARRGKLIAGVAFYHTRRGRRHFDDPLLQRAVETLLEATGYHGVGEVDARLEPRTGTYQLLEFNPRFWASLLHAANGGLNVPQLLVQLDELSGDCMLKAPAGDARLQPYEVLVRRAVQASQLAAELAHVMCAPRAERGFGPLTWLSMRLRPPGCDD